MKIANSSQINLVKNENESLRKRGLFFQKEEL